MSTLRAYKWVRWLFVHQQPNGPCQQAARRAGKRGRLLRSCLSLFAGLGYAAAAHCWACLLSFFPLLAQHTSVQLVLSVCTFRWNSLFRYGRLLVHGTKPCIHRLVYSEAQLKGCALPSREGRMKSCNNTCIIDMPDDFGLGLASVFRASCLEFLFRRCVVL